MNVKELKKRILYLTQDIEFEHGGKEYVIVPFNRNRFVLGGGNESVECTSIEAVMDTPFFGCKTLSQIVKQIKLM